tara:strand:- start:856 stop:1059 length:204 start_codon:yes stop_codon:yes gene_type:complete
MLPDPPTLSDFPPNFTDAFITIDFFLLLIKFEPFVSILPELATPFLIGLGLTLVPFLFVYILNCFIC